MKDTFYFSHDSNAKDDPKCVMLIEQLGLEGYGIYWVLIEILREQPDYKYPIALLPAIARRYNTTTEKVKAVVSAYQLFDVDEENKFFSESLIERMVPLENMRENRRMAGIKGNEIRWGTKKISQNNRSAIANLSHSDSNAIAEQSQCNRKLSLSKVKESKYNPPLTPPFDEEAQNISSKNMDVLMEYCVKYQATEGQKDELIRTTNGGESSSRVWELIKWMDEHPGHTMSDLMPTLCEMEKKGLLQCESETLYYTKKKLQKMVTPADYLQIMQYSSSDIFEDTLSKLITEVENSKGRITMPAKYIIKNLKSCV